jgi:hypothetical protein
MALFRSTRQRRIDRALSAVLERIECDHNAKLRALPDNHTWRDIDALSIDADQRAIKAYNRADKLTQIWRARVEREINPKGNSK